MGNKLVGMAIMTVPQKKSWIDTMQKRLLLVSWIVERLRVDGEGGDHYLYVVFETTYFLPVILLVKYYWYTFLWLTHEYLQSTLFLVSY